MCQIRVADPGRDQATNRCTQMLLVLSNAGHVWLLSHGADPNGERVMFGGIVCSAADTLQLLMDAGGKSSWRSWPLQLAETTSCGCCWLSPLLSWTSSMTTKHQVRTVSGLRSSWVTAALLQARRTAGVGTMNVRERSGKRLALLPSAGMGMGR